MSGKLDQSLDEILSTQRRGANPRRRSTRASAGRPATNAPVGGVKKAAKPTRNAAAKAAPAKSAPVARDSKIIVSNLPKDVTEHQIKEYFVQSVGPIKRVEISYGPNSQSRGIANVIFSKADGASKAFKALNGLLVDGRPIKIEIVVSDAQAANVIPPVKSLAERATQPKAQPKSAAADKHKNANPTRGGAARGRGAKGGRGGRGGRTGRPTRKTAEELDSEMADYFDSATQNANAGAAGTTAAPAGGNGDAPMEDEIM